MNDPIGNALKRAQREKERQGAGHWGGRKKGDAQERHARRRIAAGDPLDEIEVDEWRAELLEASDAGETQVLGYNEKVYLTPVIADLEPGARRWFRGLLKHSADTDDEAMRLDAYRDKLTSRETEIMFRALDEQINNASPAQVLEYKQKAIEA